MTKREFADLVGSLARLTLRQREALKRELMARHMWDDWDERDNPEKEINAAVSF